MREKLSEEELIKLRRILLALCAIAVNSIFNAYAIENSAGVTSRPFMIKH